MKKRLEEYRSRFPVTRNWIYFNHAATAPYDLRTAEAMGRYIRDMKENGGVNYEAWDQIREAARDGIARLLNCTPDEVAMVSNTSEGANIVAQGFAFSPGDNIVIPEGEFPANHYPWRNLHRKGVDLVTVPYLDGRIPPERILEAVNDRTRLVSVSSVAYHNGFRLDLEALGTELRRQGVPLHVDAIQSLGVIPMDVERFGISFLSADGHKWLLGPEGAGLFFCSRDYIPRLNPAYVSWLSVREPFRMEDLDQDLAETARRFEYGTPNVVGIAGLHQALSTLLEIGIDRIMTRVLQLTDRAEEGLLRKGYKIRSPREDHERSGILTFGHEKYEPEFLSGVMKEAGVVTTRRGGGIRISPHFYNNEDEVDRFLAALP